MGAKTEVESSTFKDGKRVCVQTVTYSRSDDLQTLGRLHMNLAMALNQLEKVQFSDAAYDRLLTNISNLEEQVAAQQLIVDGYKAEAGK